MPAPPIVPGLTDMPDDSPADLIGTLLTKLGARGAANAKVREWVDQGRALAHLDPRIAPLLRELLGELTDDPDEGGAAKPPPATYKIAGRLGTAKSPI